MNDAEKQLRMKEISLNELKQSEKHLMTAVILIANDRYHRYAHMSWVHNLQFKSLSNKRKKRSINNGYDGSQC